MRWSTIFFYCLFLVGVAYPQDIPRQLSRQDSQDVSVVIQSFNGLHDSVAPFQINDNEAQDLLNVKLDFGKLSKRDGYGVVSGTYTNVVSGLFSYSNASGVNQLILCTGTTIAYSTGDGTWTNLVTTMTAGNYYDAAQANDVMYLTNDSDVVQQYDGTTLTSNANVQLGRYVEHHDNRLWVADNNSVYFSESLDFDQFNLAASSNTAGQIYVRPSDGDEVRGMKSWNGQLVVCKDNATFTILGHGPPNDIHDIRLVSDEYGCVSNWGMSEYKGLLLWPAKQGIVGYDGSNIRLISDRIDAFWSNLDVGNARTTTLTETDQSDFNVGSSTGIANGISLNLNAGSIRSVWPDNFNVFRGTETTESVWLRGQDSFGYGQSYSHSIENNQLKLQLVQGSGLESVWVKTVNPVKGFADSLSYSVDMEYDDSVHDTSWPFLLVSSISVTAGDPRTDLSDYLMVAVYEGGSVGSPTYTLVIEERVGGGTRKFPYAESISDNDTNITFTLDASPKNMTLIADGDTVYDSTHTVNFINPYIYLGIYTNGTTPGSTRTAYFDNFSVGEGTGTFVSQSLDTGLTSPSWRRFNVTETIPVGSTVTYYTQVSADASSWDAAVKLDNGDTIGSASKRYIRYQADINNDLHYSSTDTVRIDKVTLSYLDSSQNAMNAIVMDDVYYLSGRRSSLTYNDRVVTFDADFGFSIYDWDTNYFTEYNDVLYHGDSNAHGVYDHSGQLNDNGTAINAYWKSKDFHFGNAFTYKTMDRGYMIGAGESGDYDLDIIVTGITNDSVNQNTNVLSLTGTNDTITRFFRIPYNRYGRFFNFEIGNDDTSEDFTVYGLGVYGKTLRIP